MSHLIPPLFRTSGLEAFEKKVCFFILVVHIMGTYQLGNSEMFGDKVLTEIKHRLPNHLNALIIIDFVVAILLLFNLIRTKFAKLFTVIVWNANYAVYIPVMFESGHSCLAFVSRGSYSYIAITFALLGPWPGVVQILFSTLMPWYMCPDEFSAYFGVHAFNSIIITACAALFVKMSNMVADRDLQLEIQEKQQMQAAKEAAETKSRYKTEFLSRMTHELKTAVSVLIAASERLIIMDKESGHAVVGEHPADEAKRPEHWHEVLFQTCIMLRSLMDNVLVLHQIEAGDQIVKNEPFSIRDAMQQASELLGVTARAVGVGFEMAVSDSVALWHVGDAVRVRQIVMNFGANAIRFCDKGHVRVTVEAETEAEGDQKIAISVEDTGTGLCLEQQAAIMDPEAAVIAERGGTGLGLPIVRQLVGGMRGHFDVESDGVGHGSTFHAHITLPVDEHGTPLSDAPLPHVPRSVLLVEDHNSLRFLIKELLNDDGHTVTPACNGREAVDLFTSATYDIVLMDIQMPVLDGIEATKLIREHEVEHGLRRTPIIAMTARSLGTELKACDDAGCDGFLAKPVDQASLSRVVDSLGGLADALCV